MPPRAPSKSHIPKISQSIIQKQPTLSEKLRAMPKSVLDRMVAVGATVSRMRGDPLVSINFKFPSPAYSIWREFCATAPDCEMDTAVCPARGHPTEMQYPVNVEATKLAVVYSNLDTDLEAGAPFAQVPESVDMRSLNKRIKFNRAGHVLHKLCEHISSGTDCPLISTISPGVEVICITVHQPGALIFLEVIKS